MIAAIIPARGGSKGILRKNLQEVGGVSLVARSIIDAQRAACVDEVWVSTDDDEIAAEANDYGARLHKRDPETATDEASSESAIIEWLNACFYSAKSSRNQAMGARWAGARPDPELVVFLQATSPLRQPDDIDRAVATLLTHHVDSLFGARRIEGYVWRNDGALQPMYRQRKRRQDERVTWYEENGSLYVFRTAMFRIERRRLFGEIRPYEMHPFASFQVDEPGDLDNLRALHDVCQRTILATA